MVHAMGYSASHTMFFQRGCVRARHCVNPNVRGIADFCVCASEKRAPRGYRRWTKKSNPLEPGGPPGPPGPPLSFQNARKQTRKTHAKTKHTKMQKQPTPSKTRNVCVDGWLRSCCLFPRSVSLFVCVRCSSPSCVFTFQRLL